MIASKSFVVIVRMEVSIVPFVENKELDFPDHLRQWLGQLLLILIHTDTTIVTNTTIVTVTTTTTTTTLSAKDGNVDVNE